MKKDAPVFHETPKPQEQADVSKVAEQHISKEKVASNDKPAVQKASNVNNEVAKEPITKSAVQQTNKAELQQVFTKPDD